mmetsp:Transcript_31148/g.48787  ORF Transcript_31148/g.48787 Transcript_31148/m.48787 type:complete len:80 (-) Transcript_31148:1056-1295(-)
MPWIPFAGFQGLEGCMPPDSLATGSAHSQGFTVVDNYSCGSPPCGCYSYVQPALAPVASAAPNNLAPGAQNATVRPSLG